MLRRHETGLPRRLSWHFLSVAPSYEQSVAPSRESGKAVALVHDDSAARKTDIAVRHRDEAVC